MEAVLEKVAQIEVIIASNPILTIKCRGRAKLYLGLPDPVSGRIIEGWGKIHQLNKIY